MFVVLAAASALANLLRDQGSCLGLTVVRAVRSSALGSKEPILAEAVMRTNQKRFSSFLAKRSLIIHDALGKLAGNQQVVVAD